jgi:tripartite-type tricarboxylate transporter receptor subunit TctC
MDGGVGSISHLAGVLLQNQTGTRFQLVPYRTTLMMQDLLAAQLDFLIDLAPNAVPMLVSRR